MNTDSTKRVLEPRGRKGRKEGKVELDHMREVAVLAFFAPSR